MSCAIIQKRIADIAKLKKTSDNLLQSLPTKQISIPQYIQTLDELQKGIQTHSKFLLLHQRELHQLGALLREKFNLQSVGSFENGCAKAMDWNYTVFYIDTKGNRIEKRPESTYTYQQPRLEKNNRKYYYLKPDGSKLNNEKYKFANMFSNGIAVVKKNTFHYITTSGEKLNNEEYTGAGDFNCGLASVEQNGSWHYIKTDGTKLNNNQYSYAGDFNNGTAKVVLHERGFSIDVNGKEIVKDSNKTTQYQ